MDTSKRIDEALEELLFGEHDDERKAIQEAKSLIMEELQASHIRGFRDGLMWVQKDILDKVGKGSYKLQGNGVESGVFIVRDDITLKLSQMNKEENYE